MLSQKKFSKFDHEMMNQALLEAKKSFDKEEVPVGAVLVHDQKIIARAHNQIEELKDPSAHAEVLAIRSGAEVLGDWRLLKTTLYTTLEPCLMCRGALLLARVERAVWGAPDLRHGVHGSQLNVFEPASSNHSLHIEGGLLQEESATLIREFFKIQRQKDEKVVGRSV